MKKSLLGLFAAVVLLAPSFSYAQTASSTDLQTQYQAVLVQLITLLQQQIQSIEAQLSALKDSQDSVAEDVKTIKTSTTVNSGNSQGVDDVAPLKVNEISYSFVQNRGKSPSDDSLWIKSNQLIDLDSIEVTQNGETFDTTPTLAHSSGSNGSYSEEITFSPSPASTITYESEAGFDISFDGATSGSYSGQIGIPVSFDKNHGRIYSDDNY